MERGEPLMLWPQIGTIITADVQPPTNTHITLQVKKNTTTIIFCNFL